MESTSPAFWASIYCCQIYFKVSNHSLMATRNVFSHTTNQTLHCTYIVIRTYCTTVLILYGCAWHSIENRHEMIFIYPIHGLYIISGQMEKNPLNTRWHCIICNVSYHWFEPFLRDQTYGRQNGRWWRWSDVTRPIPNNYTRHEQPSPWQAFRDVTRS